MELLISVRPRGNAFVANANGGRAQAKTAEQAARKCAGKSMSPIYSLKPVTQQTWIAIGFCSPYTRQLCEQKAGLA